MSSTAIFCHTSRAPTSVRLSSPFDTKFMNMFMALQWLLWSCRHAWYVRGRTELVGWIESASAEMLLNWHMTFAGYKQHNKSIELNERVLDRCMNSNNLKIDIDGSPNWWIMIEKPLIFDIKTIGSWTLNFKGAIAIHSWVIFPIKNAKRMVSYKESIEAPLGLPCI